jgi:hypothetical protein
MAGLLTGLFEGLPEGVVETPCRSRSEFRQVLALELERRSAAVREPPMGVSEISVVLLLAAQSWRERLLHGGTVQKAGGEL